MKRFYIIATFAAGLGLSLAACGNDLNPGPNHPGPGTKFTQTELWGRPAVKEGLEAFMSHDATNRTEPYNDPTLSQNIQTFASTVAKRDGPTTAALVQILGLDEMQVDLSSTSPKAAYLGVESGGATGSKFGGRALNDDVIDLDLGVVFGDTLAKLGVVPSDGKFSPCLTTDNVGYDKANTSTFPYVQAPV